MAFRRNQNNIAMNSRASGFALSDEEINESGRVEQGLASDIHTVDHQILYKEETLSEATEAITPASEPWPSVLRGNNPSPYLLPRAPPSELPSLPSSSSFQETKGEKEEVNSPNFVEARTSAMTFGKGSAGNLIDVWLHEARMERLKQP
jgi:hypothetical protein